MTHMKDFGVHRDIEVYRQMLDLMPKGKYIAENYVQAVFSYYPKQQDCIPGTFGENGGK